MNWLQQYRDVGGNGTFLPRRRLSSEYSSDDCKDWSVFFLVHSYSSIIIIQIVFVDGEDCEYPSFHSECAIFSLFCLSCFRLYPKKNYDYNFSSQCTKTIRIDGPTFQLGSPSHYYDEFVMYAKLGGGGGNDKFVQNRRRICLGKMPKIVKVWIKMIFLL